MVYLPLALVIVYKADVKGFEGVSEIFTSALLTPLVTPLLSLIVPVIVIYTVFAGNTIGIKLICFSPQMNLCGVRSTDSEYSSLYI